MKLKQIVKVLKEHELYCYQIAYFILEHEGHAVLAAEQALLELGSYDGFLTESPADRWKKAKKVCIKHSLKISTMLELRASLKLPKNCANVSQTGKHLK